MEIHLSQEDRDPLALHSVVAMTTLSDNEKEISISQGHGSEAGNGDVAMSETLQEASTSAGELVTETMMMESLPSVPTASPSPPLPSDHTSALDARSPYKTSSSLTANPTSLSTDTQSLSTTATMNSMTSGYLASPSLSPSPNACAYDSQDVGWTPSLSTLLPLASETGGDVDAEMASPTELTAPAPFLLATPILKSQTAMNQEQAQRPRLSAILPPEQSKSSSLSAALTPPATVDCSNNRNLLFRRTRTLYWQVDRVLYLSRLEVLLRCF
jgi:hypothetical protein